MKTVVLVTCTKNKHSGTQTAGYLYSKSKNFCKHMELSRLITSDDNIYILSALHGLLSLDTVIDWYDYTLMGKSRKTKDAWGRKVFEQINSRYNVNETTFIVIAGADYYNPLKPYLPNMEIPLKGLSISYKSARVNALIKEMKEKAGL